MSVDLVLCTAYSNCGAPLLSRPADVARSQAHSTVSDNYTHSSCGNSIRRNIMGLKAVVNACCRHAQTSAVNEGIHNSSPAPRASEPMKQNMNPEYRAVLLNFNGSAPMRVRWTVRCPHRMKWLSAGVWGSASLKLELSSSSLVLPLLLLAGMLLQYSLHTLSLLVARSLALCNTHTAHTIVRPSDWKKREHLLLLAATRPQRRHCLSAVVMVKIVLCKPTVGRSDGILLPKSDSQP